MSSTHRENNANGANGLDIHRVFRTASSPYKAKLRQDCMEFLVPHPSRLFKSIERLEEMQHMIRVAIIETFWLLHVDGFIQVFIGECHGDVNGMKVEIMDCRECKDKTNGGLSHSACIYLTIVISRALIEALSNNSGFIAIHRSIIVALLICRAVLLLLEVYPQSPKSDAPCDQ